MRNRYQRKTYKKKKKRERDLPKCPKRCRKIVVNDKLYFWTGGASFVDIFLSTHHARSTLKVALLDYALWGNWGYLDTNTPFHVEVTYDTGLHLIAKSIEYAIEQGWAPDKDIKDFSIFYTKGMFHVEICS